MSEKAGNKRWTSAALCARVVCAPRELVPCLTTWNRHCKQTSVPQMHRDAKLWLRHWQDDWLLALLKRAIWQFYSQTLPTEPLGELQPSQNTAAKTGREIISPDWESSLSCPKHLQQLQEHIEELMVQWAQRWKNRRPVTAPWGCTAHTCITPSDTDAKYWNSHLRTSVISFLPKPSCIIYPPSFVQLEIHHSLTVQPTGVQGRNSYPK